MQLKKHSVWLVAIFSLFLGSGFLKKVKPKTVYQESWIGTINYSYTIGDRRTAQEGETKTEFELTRNTEITINVTGNRKGFATIRHNMRQWEKTTAPFVKEEKYIQITERTENSVDSGEVDVDVEINDQTHTYWLKTSGPQYRVEGTSSFWTSTAGHGLGPPQQQISEVDGIPIDVPDQQLGKNRNEISGSYVIFSSATHDVVVSWNLVKEPVDAVLIVSPSDYDSWLPEPGPDEFTVGSVMNIDLKLQRRNGQPAAVIAKSFELRLSNTSKEPGITLNAPINPIVDLPDLRFMEQPNGQISEEYQVIKMLCRNGSSGNVKIGSYDGGGWTTLTAVATLEDGTKIKGSLFIPGGKKEIPIPKRDPGSNIAIAWLRANGNPGDGEDVEASNGGNTYLGDGLSAYEEYRGVISETKFKRLDPKKKELGVRIKSPELNLFSEGISWFETASGMKIIPFYSYEIGDDRRLNKNASYRHIYQQYVLILKKGAIASSRRDSSVVGRAVGGPGVPKEVDYIIIDADKISRFFYRHAAPTQLLYTLAEDLANTVAHEISHGVNVWHHGPRTNVPNVTARDSVPPYRIFSTSNSEITRRPYSLRNISMKGNQESGDISCFMAYIKTSNWAFNGNFNGSPVYYEVPQSSLGKTMCISKRGTSINDPANIGINNVNKYFGNAASGDNRGNCLYQVKLK